MESIRLCARGNEPRTADIDTRTPAFRGTFKDVYLGKYTSGEASGKKCVAKLMRNRCYVSIQTEIDVVKKAVSLIKKFNQEVLCGSGLSVHINMPQVWFTEDGRTGLAEPYLTSYKKFNTNTGYEVTTTGWDRVMQALSHFSFHTSSGQYVLCDLQGSLDVSTGTFTLSDPVVLSRNRRFGQTDLGPKGIRNFFHFHTCTEFCNAEWHRPKLCKQEFQATLQGTARTTDGCDLLATESTASTRSLNAFSQFTASTGCRESCMGDEDTLDNHPDLPTSHLQFLNSILEEPQPQLFQHSTTSCSDQKEAPGTGQPALDPAKFASATKASSTAFNMHEGSAAEVQANSDHVAKSNNPLDSFAQILSSLPGDSAGQDKPGYPKHMDPNKLLDVAQRVIADNHLSMRGPQEITRDMCTPVQWPS